MRPVSVLTGVGGVLAVVGGLAIVDERVRYQLGDILRGDGATRDFATAGSRIEDVTMVVLQAVRDQSIEHAPLTIFALAALVLVLFMLRT